MTGLRVSVTNDYWRVRRLFHRIIDCARVYGVRASVSRQDVGERYQCYRFASANGRPRGTEGHLQRADFNSENVTKFCRYFVNRMSRHDSLRIIYLGSRAKL